MDVRKDHNRDVDLGKLTSGSNNILLVNTHAIDVRLPWSKWHQPTGLLQIGQVLKSKGIDVRFIDCLGHDKTGRIRRRKVGEIDIEGYQLDLWRYGRLWSKINKDIQKFKNEGWIPDQIFVSCPQTTWWRAAKELISNIKSEWFPNVEVLLGGTYPCLEYDHARLYTNADQIVSGSIAKASGEEPAFELYPDDLRPNFTGIYLYHSQDVNDVQIGEKIIPRSPDAIASEYDEKASLGVTEFAFFDDEILREHRDHFIQVLKAIVSIGRKLTGFISIGNISPEFINKDVAYWMGKANYRNVYLKCDVIYDGENARYETTYDTYKSCVKVLQSNAEFKPRSGQVTAMLLIGHPNEDIEKITERLIILASIVGSVNLVQYQYSRGTEFGEQYTNFLRKQNGNLNLIKLNCKLYPLSRLLGIPYKDYVELTRLATLLNNKFRSKTFNFLGDDIVAKMVRKSFRTEGWKPLEEKSDTSKYHIQEEPIRGTEK